MSFCASTRSKRVCAASLVKDTTAPKKGLHNYQILVFSRFSRKRANPVKEVSLFIQITIRRIQRLENQTCPWLFLNNLTAFLPKENIRQSTRNPLAYLVSY